MKWQDKGFDKILVSTVPDGDGRDTSLDILKAEGREGLLIGLPRADGFAGFVGFAESWPKTLTAAKELAEAMMPPSPISTMLCSRIVGRWSIVWWRLARTVWRPS